MTTLQAPIVVGYDGTAGADTALEWATREAVARGLPMRIVFAATFVPEEEHLQQGADESVAEVGRRLAEDMVTAAKRRVEDAAPGLAVTAADLAAAPARALVRESLTAAMVVIGSRHRGAIGSAFLGSVASAVTQRAACPVVVVRGPAGEPAEGACVVVGVDGKSPSDGALAFAFDHADAHRVPLEAVLCWPPDALTEMSWRGSPPAPDHAAAIVSEVVAGWSEKYPDVVVRTSVVRDHPAAGLVAASTAQELLVVGRHGRHVVPGALLGSTSMGVLHHATCPVAVVPEV